MRIFRRYCNALSLLQYRNIYIYIRSETFKNFFSDYHYHVKGGQKLIITSSVHAKRSCTVWS